MIHLSGTRFGDLSLEDHAEISFPDGIIGFSGETRFAILERTRGPIAYLQSLTTPRLALPMIDATILRPAYPDMPVEELAELTGARPAHIAILVIVAVDPFDSELRANLLAPVVIDVDARIGKQIILEDTHYTTSVHIGNRMPTPKQNHPVQVAHAPQLESAER